MQFSAAWHWFLWCIIDFGSLLSEKTQDLHPYKTLRKIM